MFFVCNNLIHYLIPKISVEKSEGNTRVGGLLASISSPVRTRAGDCQGSDSGPSQIPVFGEAASPWITCSLGAGSGWEWGKTVICLRSKNKRGSYCLLWAHLRQEDHCLQEAPQLFSTDSMCHLSCPNEALPSHAHLAGCSLS